MLSQETTYLKTEKEALEREIKDLNDQISRITSEKNQMTAQSVWIFIKIVKILSQRLLFIWNYHLYEGQILWRSLQASPRIHKRMQSARRFKEQSK